MPNDVKANNTKTYRVSHHKNVKSPGPFNQQKKEEKPPKKSYKSTAKHKHTFSTLFSLQNYCVRWVNADQVREWMCFGAHLIHHINVRATILNLSQLLFQMCVCVCMFV